MTDQPTVRAVSALLRRAGFVRSDVHRRDVEWNAGSTGFSIWSSRMRQWPGVPVVALVHYDKGQHDRGQWDWHARKALRQVEEYAVVIEAAGYRVVRQYAKDDPQIVVLAAEPPTEASP